MPLFLYINEAMYTHIYIYIYIHTYMGASILSLYPSRPPNPRWLRSHLDPGPSTSTENYNFRNDLDGKLQCSERPRRNTQYARINTQYALYKYARIRTTYQIETDGKASRNKKNKAPPSATTQRGARAARAPLWVSCFSYSYLLFHVSI